MLCLRTLACGTRAATSPAIPVDGRGIFLTDQLVGLEELPHELIVVGAGVIGLEMGSVWARLGTEVTEVEYLDRILPGTDTEVAALARKLFEKQGLTFKLGVRVTGARREGDACVVTADSSTMTSVISISVGRML